MRIWIKVMIRKKSSSNLLLKFKDLLKNPWISKSPKINNKTQKRLKKWSQNRVFLELSKFSALVTSKAIKLTKKTTRKICNKSCKVFKGYPLIDKLTINKVEKGFSQHSTITMPSTVWATNLLISNNIRKT